MCPRLSKILSTPLTPIYLASMTRSLSISLQRSWKECWWIEWVWVLPEGKKNKKTTQVSTQVKSDKKHVWLGAYSVRRLENKKEEAVVKEESSMMWLTFLRTQVYEMWPTKFPDRIWEWSVNGQRILRFWVILVIQVNNVLIRSIVLWILRWTNAWGSKI